VIAAEATVPASPEAVFELLADLEEHWRLAGRWVRVLELHRSPAAPGPGPDSGRVRVRGPLGVVRRTVFTRVVEAVRPERVEGTARIGSTHARVRWTLRPAVGEHTSVRLEAVVERASVADRLLLACGGARWLRGRFASTLARLAVEASGSPPLAARSAVG
jgi:hypothetical protein